MTNQWEGIVKIQRPLTSSEANPPVLIYSADRHIYLTHVMTEEEMDNMFGHALKIYVRALLDHNGLLQLDIATATEEGDF